MNRVAVVALVVRVVRRHAVRVVSFRFRATFRSRWGGYLALVVLLGLVGGVALAAMAAARRTQSSFPAYMASINSSDIGLITGAWDPAINSTGYNPTLVNTVAHLPHVKHAETELGLNIFVLGANGLPTQIPVNINDEFASLDGLLLDQDRATVTTGRLPDPARADEVAMTAKVADGLGLHVGDLIHMGAYNMSDFKVPEFVAGTLPPRAKLDVTLVGIILFSDKVVPDDVDLGNREEDIIFTPPVARRFKECCAYLSATGLLLEHGSRDVVAVEAEIAAVLPATLPHLFTIKLASEAKAERAIKPLAVALGVFGGIALLAALLIALQVIGRQLRLGANDVAVMRALGASPTMTSADGLIGVLGSVIVGSLLTFAVAFSLSPLAPLGPVRRVDPHSGLDVDWTVLGLGVVALIVVLAAGSLALSRRVASERALGRRSRREGRGSRIAHAAAVSGLPVPAVVGIRLAIDPGVGRNTVPVRSAILGATLAMAVITGTLTFGASMQTLVSRPALYGWNWDYELSSVPNDIPIDTATKLLSEDRDVIAWSGVYFTSLLIDGATVPVIGGSPKPAVGPALLSGHDFNATDEVVLGATTLAKLHKHIGDTVDVTYSSATPTTRLRIVGTATMPTTGGGGGEHLTMGNGAWLDENLIPSQVRNPFGGASGTVGPNVIFVRVRNGVNKATALKDFKQLVTALPTSNEFGIHVDVVPLQRPAEIIIYRSMANTLLFLGAGLALGAFSALALTLVASVRRRQRDLSMLKALGLTPRQLAALVAWQSTVAVTIGAVVGVPLGVIIGRALWSLFADALHVAPRPTAPVLTISLIAIGALILANIVAAIPGRTASRTPTAALLHAE